MSALWDKSKISSFCRPSRRRGWSCEIVLSNKYNLFRVERESKNNEPGNDFITLAFRFSDSSLFSPLNNEVRSCGGGSKRNDLSCNTLNFGNKLLKVSDWLESTKMVSLVLDEALLSAATGVSSLRCNKWSCSKSSKPLNSIFNIVEFIEPLRFNVSWRTLLISGMFSRKSSVSLSPDLDSLSPSALEMIDFGDVRCNRTLNCMSGIGQLVKRKASISSMSKPGGKNVKTISKVWAWSVYLYIAML